MLYKLTLKVADEKKSSQIRKGEILAVMPILH